MEIGCFTNSCVVTLSAILKVQIKVPPITAPPSAAGPNDNPKIGLPNTTTLLKKAPYIAPCRAPAAKRSPNVKSARQKQYLIH